MSWTTLQPHFTQTEDIHPIFGIVLIRERRKNVVLVHEGSILICDSWSGGNDGRLTHASIGTRLPWHPPVFGVRRLMGDRADGYGISISKICLMCRRRSSYVERRSTFKNEAHSTWCYRRSSSKYGGSLNIGRHCRVVFNNLRRMC